MALATEYAGLTLTPVVSGELDSSSQASGVPEMTEEATQDKIERMSIVIHTIA